MFSPIIRSQVNYIVSAIEVIIETHIQEKRYYNYSKRIIKKTAIRVHYMTETMSRLTVTLMNCQKDGFH